MTRSFDFIVSILRVFSYEISCFFPRNKSIWCFGSSFGFSNNAKYLYTYLLDNPHPSIKPIWIANKALYLELKKTNIPCVKRWSLKGLWLTLRSGTYIYDSYVSDINIYTAGNVTKVNLWHGVGIKNIERKISTGPLKKIFDSKNPFVKLRHLNLFIKPDVFLSSSELMTEHFSRCFAIRKETCVESSYPRNNIFYLDNIQLKKYISKYESQTLADLLIEFERYKKIYLYMPTWRDSGKDFCVSLSLDFNKINEIMKRANALFLFKPHPATKINQKIDNLSNVRVINNKTDLYPVMPKIDSFITDYSSVYYDWLLLSNKELIFYIPDLNEYKSTERDLAFSFEENTEGLKITNFMSFLAYLNGEIEWESKYDSNQLNKIKRKFWGESCENSASLDRFINMLVK